MKASFIAVFPAVIERALRSANGVVANDAQAADRERSNLVFRSNCSGKPAILAS